jgi:CRISPR-associated protein Cas2
MARRRYLVAYDIRDPRRLREVFRIMKSYGEHVQYSVFLCDLDGTEKPLLLGDIGKAIKHTEDSVVLVDLGEAVGRGTLCFEFLGVHRPLPRPGGSVIV